MFYLILASIFLTASVLLGATASRNANTNLVSLVVNISSVVVPLLIFAPKLMKSSSFSNQKYGIITAALSGLLIGCYVLTLTKAFTQNKLAIISPAIYGGVILLTAIFGYILFKEKITVLEGLGIVLVLAGLAVIIYARTALT